MDYNDDEAISEIQDEMYQQEEERPKGGISKFHPKSRFMVALVAGVVLFFMVTGNISVKAGAVILIVGAFILSFMQTSDAKRNELSWIECQVRISDQLKFLQKHPIGDYPQIPKGEVRVKPVGRKQWYEGKSFKRSFGIDLYDKDKDIIDSYFVEVDIFSGDILTFKFAPEGVYGDETKDIKMIPSYDMLINKRRDKYMGKGKK